MREEKYDISGMHCAACSASVERVTRKLPGVERSDVNLTTEIMTICYDESQVTPEQITAKVEKAGFGCALHAEKQETAQQDPADAEAAELRHWHRLCGHRPDPDGNGQRTAGRGGYGRRPPDH